MRTILLISIVGWILIPTGTPDDFIALFLIKYLGIYLYLLTVIFFLIFLWYKKITIKQIGKEIQKQFKKINKRFKK